MYTVAVIPIVVGTAIAFWEQGIFQGSIFYSFLGAAISIIAWLNISNDVFDAETGIDINKPHSIVQLTGNRSLMFWVGNGFLALGLGAIALICYWQQDLTVLGLMVLACGLGYSYQGPPFRLGYQGLGEFICLIAFGPVAIAAVYYAQCQSFTFTSLLLSNFVGLTTAIILFCSHFHQVQDDIKAGKRSPIVRLGTKRGAQVLALGVGATFLLVGGFLAWGLIPRSCLLVALSAPWAGQLLRHVFRYHHQPQRVSNCKFIAVRWHFVSGALFAVGLALPRWFPWV